MAAASAARSLISIHGSRSPRNQNSSARFPSCSAERPWTLKPHFSRASFVASIAGTPSINSCRDARSRFVLFEGHAAKKSAKAA